MKKLLFVGSLLSLACAVPCVVGAASLPDRSFPASTESLQVGSSWVEFLLCVGEARAAGSPWETAFQVCADTDTSSGARATGSPESIQVGGSWTEYLLCVGEARAAGSPWETAFQVCADTDTSSGARVTGSDTHRSPGRESMPPVPVSRGR